MGPFRITFTLARRHRLGELVPWLPAVVAGVAFTVGTGFFAAMFSLWLLWLLVLPLVLFWNLYKLLWELAVSPGKPAEVIVDGETLAVVKGSDRRERPLAGIIQVYHGGPDWVVLHADRTSLHIPTEAVTNEQIEYLKSFAPRPAHERK